MAKVWRPVEKQRMPNSDPKHDNYLVVRDKGREIIIWENKSGGVGLPFNPPDHIRICELVDVDDVPVVQMTPESAATLALVIKAAWAGYGGDVYDEPFVRDAIEQWETLLTELGAQAGEEPCN